VTNFQPIKRAVIPAAGLGTRFLPATKATPKEMLPIVDKPTIQYIVEEALQSGIEDILIITGRSKRAIEDHFDRSIELELNLEEKGKTEMLKMVRAISDIRIHYIRQKEPLGLGHAIPVCQAVHRARALCCAVGRRRGVQREKAGPAPAD
jgi:UTP--glucose-1-phosphate uridylyltransferase